MLPLSLPFDQPSSRDAVRALSLTPPGVSPNDVFRAINPSIDEGCTQGFQGKDENGNDQRIFLDIVGFLSDFLETGLWLDVLGHNGVACCPLSSSLRFQRPPSEGSAYCLQTDAHSRDSALYEAVLEPVLSEIPILPVMSSTL